MAFLNMGAGITGGRIGPGDAITARPATTHQPPASGSYLEPEHTDAYNAWKADPSPENMSALLTKVDPIINRAIRTYAPSSLDDKGVASPITYSRARLDAAKYLKSYDPSKASIKTHLMSQLQGLRRQTAKQERIIRAPEQALLELNRLHKARAELADEIGREPSDMELADYTGISVKRMKHIRKFRDAVPESYYLGLRKDEEGMGIEPAVLGWADRNRAWHDFVYHNLAGDPKSQLIMEHTLGMHGKPVMMNQDIAKMLGLSPAAVSLRKQKIQKMIDERDELRVI